MIEYKIRYRNNYLDIKMTIPKQYLQQKQILSMARYIPGSYMLRDFASNIVEVTVNNKPLFKLSHSSWYIDEYQYDVEINYTIYAKDPSVRGCFASDERVLINGASSFLYLENYRNIPYKLTIALQKSWKIHTSLPRANHEFFAPDFDTLIDYPILISKIATRHTIDDNHEIVFWGNSDLVDRKVISDIKSICNYQQSFFDSNPKNYAIDKYVPDIDYLFITQIGEMYGGLEHRASTVLQIDDKSINPNNKESYINFLGLVSHEYFHSWWVKKVKPQSFINQSLQKEFDTSLLWIFEGFTSYFDNLILLKSGCISIQEYIKLLEKNINAVYKYDGHKYHSLHDASVDAWIKYYKPTPNSHNTTVSYYTKGALLALCLDLHLRKNSHGSLEKVIKDLVNKYNTDDLKGITYDIFVNQINLSCNIDVADYLKNWVYFSSKYADLPIFEYLQHFGIDIKTKLENIFTWGIQYKSYENQILIEKIHANGVADQAELSIGDKIIAVNNKELNVNNIDDIFKTVKKGQITITGIRNRQLFEKVLKCSPLEQKLFELSLSENFDARLNGWLC